MAHLFKRNLAKAKRGNFPLHMSATKNIHIGTSGWSYKHWRQLYYPEKLAASKWLNYYAETFHSTEINGSFYRLPGTETVMKWMQQVPADFLFCPKMSRYLTHAKKLREPEEPLERFFGVFAPMQQMLGPVLVQLPHMLAFHAYTADYFFNLIKEKYSAYEFVLEVRHPSWLEKESILLLTQYKIGLVISQSEGKFPYSEIVTSKNVYVRFHGPAALYASPYPDQLLKSYAAKFKRWEKQNCAVWAYFNNDIGGYAVEDAKRLMQMVEKRKSSE
jgi:uncharacterized protein YecE (DUF72 family)